MKKLITIITFLHLLLLSNAQTGNLDSSFGRNGKVYFDFAQLKVFSGVVQQLLAQDDGKIVAVLQIGTATALVRFSADGTLDSSYGINGFTSLLLPVYQPKAIMQNDNKVVITGQYYTTNVASDFVVYRILENGFLDKGFGLEGKQVTDLGNANIPFSVIVRADEKLMVAVNSFDDNWKIELVQFTKEGKLDTSFSKDGRQIVNIENGLYFNSVVAQDDGKIIIAGNITEAFQSDFALMRLHSDGTIDEGFGKGGLVTTDFGYNEQVFALAIQDDGNIVAAGQIDKVNNTDIAVARYKTDGSIDSSFSVDGLQTTDFGLRDIAVALVVQKDQKIIISGQTTVAGSNGVLGGTDFILVRYHANGEPDKGFGKSGIITTNFNSPTDFANSAMLQPDGKIIVGGGTVDSIHNINFALARYTNTGLLDSTFSSQGKLTDYRKVSHTTINDLLIHSDGKVSVAGLSAFDAAIQKFNMDGTSDSLFNKGGSIITHIDSLPLSSSAAALQSDGKILVAGFSNTNTQALVLLRYDAQNDLDKTFGKAGIQVILLDTSSGSENRNPLKLGIQPDGKIIIAASSGGTNSDFLVVRLKNDGTLDSTFGFQGKLFIDFGYDERLTAMAILSDGRIMVTGYSTKNIKIDTTTLSKSIFVSARYNNNGSPDKTFDADGKMIMDLGDFEYRANAFALQADGKAVLAGYASLNGKQRDLAVARLNVNGTPDITFGKNGIQLTDVDSADQIATAITILEDQTIVVAGQTGQDPSNRDIILARYQTNGAPDSTFGTNGIVITDLGSAETVASIKVSNNRLYVAGHVGDEYYTTGFLAAYRLVLNKTSININDVTVKKQDTKATLTVSLSQPLNEPLEIFYEVFGKKYQGTFVIPKQVVAFPISLPLFWDNTNNATQYYDVGLHLISKVKNVVFSDRVGRVTILNTDVTSYSLDVVAGTQSSLIKRNQQFSITAFPNPSNNYYNLQLLSNSNEVIQIQVVDLSGRIIETKAVSANGSLTIGAGYRAGTYYVRALQGKNKKIIKLVKL